MLCLVATEKIYERAAHPYKHALLSAIPIPDPEVQKKRQRIVLKGDVPSPVHLPSGCRFHTRCPLVTNQCKVEESVFEEKDLGHWVAYHYG
ncbi:oligopeptide/dipeptide ABC transporter ATP-binding protein [Pseudogracilibacillus sp. SE30717A]|uniref:oligopeptide/dipeptide ABC transporter ATP-binding protein n=1 Tax=Pseudogracilibacillus sp. SE30717A TaxID=3098293 RepID=UPI00300DDEEB